MTLSELKGILVDISFFNRGIFSSRLVASFEKVFKACNLRDPNLERELTSEEHHHLYASCLWKYKPNSATEKLLFDALRKTECEHLGFQALDANYQLLEYLNANNCLTLEVVNFLFDISLNGRPLLTHDILHRLAAPLWTSENLNRIKLNRQHQPVMLTLMKEVGVSLCDQPTLNLLIEKSREMNEFLVMLKRLFILASPIKESDLCFFGENTWLFKHDNIMAYLEINRGIIASQIKAHPYPLFHIVSKAMEFANVRGIDRSSQHNPQQDNVNHHREALIPVVNILAENRPQALAEPLLRPEGYPAISPVRYEGAFFAVSPSAPEAIGSPALDGHWVAPPGGMVVIS